MAIITLEDYREFTGINSPNKDLQLQVLVDFVNEFIPEYCGVQFEPTLQLDKPVTKDQRHIIFLPDYPISGIDKLAYRDPDNVETLMDLANCIVDLEGGEIFLGLVPAITADPSTFPMTDRQYAYRVTYTYGHATTPSSIYLAALEMVKHYDKEKYMGSKNLGNGQQVSYSDKRYIPPHIRMALDVCRRT